MSKKSEARRKRDEIKKWGQWTINFWSRVNAPDENGCWTWRGETASGDYGRIRIEGKGMAAHRVAYQLEFGPIPQGYYACHTCDNTKCVNPWHIFIGTPGDNARDMFRKGRNSSPHSSFRFSKGFVRFSPIRVGSVGAPASIEDEELIAQMREAHSSGLNIKQVAEKFGKPKSTVRYVLKKMGPYKDP